MEKLTVSDIINYKEPECDGCLHKQYCWGVSDVPFACAIGEHFGRACLRRDHLFFEDDDDDDMFGWEGGDDEV